MFEEIRTERLALRNLQLDDASRIFEYRSHPDVNRFLSWGTDSADAIRASVQAMSGLEPGRDGSWYQLGIVSLSSGELVGDCGFRMETGRREAEVGIALAPEIQGQGYASEALGELLTYLFVELRTHRVFGSVDPRNARSLRLLQRVGMREEGRFVRSLWFKGEWVDEVIFAVLASEWQFGIESGPPSGLSL